MWILIVVFTTIGGDAGVSITSVPGFESSQLCEAAGTKAKRELAGMTTWIRHACVQAKSAP